jgi:hypothetical protein
MKQKLLELKNLYNLCGLNNFESQNCKKMINKIRYSRQIALDEIGELAVWVVQFYKI